ncbi:hypothetical protein U9M48_026370 [Paspalum notatum var. saurae]|uniref:Replication protein A 70 kDa DNA-binding subunit B/D first OB fold domain-containing protein n=1 Tax=Paspalum notatum var. saurae TaxID=547442 RepID=A0AAQ3WY91_PASNO
MCPLAASAWRRISEIDVDPSYRCSSVHNESETKKRKTIGPRHLKFTSVGSASVASCGLNPVDSTRAQKTKRAASSTPLILDGPRRRNAAAYIRLVSENETPQPRLLRRNATASHPPTKRRSTLRRNAAATPSTIDFCRREDRGEKSEPTVKKEEIKRLSHHLHYVANITPVSDLRPGRIDYTIHVRISRMWEFRGPNEENDLRHLDLILIDQKGDPIYAEIPPNAVPDLKSFLEEGKIIIMSKITVERAKPGYRAVENPYMIKLNTRTCIFPCAETINFPKYTFSLTPFEILPQYIRRTDRFLDVIGKITGVSNAAKVYNTSGDPMMRRVIRLQDLMGNVIELSLSCKGATEFPAEAVLDVGQKHHVIAIFVGTLMKLYRDEHRFLSETSACRWYINENDIPAIKTFQKRYKIPFITTDGTYSLEFIFFEKKGVELIGKTAETLHKQYDLNQIPPQISELIGQKFSLVVTVSTKRSINRKDSSFEVLMIKERFGKQPIIPVFRPEITIAPDSESTTISHEKDLPALIAIPSKKSNAQFI